MRVEITYASGNKEERTLSDCPTLEHVANSAFGMSLADVQEHGCSITDLDSVAEEPVVEPVVEPVLTAEEPVAPPAEPVIAELAKTKKKAN